eukprot:CAMPEP_0115494244 /NCGR_PEP_ID=MMETSP0271-20121206/64616_1 /TAXON_ID=71861 /ORGANISM="Scrippsiella trochoidea, Strain CCMP3099" /LENGTH=643 /DNA_ID=CAMNT_0002922809 /DNA_START=28 /DNA_END=1959 /DNA_ORIENTATION=+
MARSLSLGSLQSPSPAAALASPQRRRGCRRSSASAVDAAGAAPALRRRADAPLLPPGGWAHRGVPEALLRSRGSGLVEHLDIQVDSATQSVEPIGEHLRCLKQLKLMDSSVLCLRDLGTELRGLEVLWISRCGLQDLGGVGAALQSLRELYMPFNDVADLSPLSGHDALEVLDIEGNAIAEREEVASLSTCSSLRELTLSGNPVVRSGPQALTREAVITMLPQLEILDDVSTDPEVASSARVPGLGEADLDDDLDELVLDDVGDDGGGAVCAAGLRHRGLSGNYEEFPAGASDDDDDDEEDEQSASLESFHGLASPSLRAGGSGGIAGIAPLQPQHPLLAEGLARCAEEPPPGETPSSSRFGVEPDEDELINERVKRSRPKGNMPHAHTARPAVGWFGGLHMQDRRQVWTSESEPPSFRPMTSAGGSSGGGGSGAGSGALLLDGLAGAQDAASELTCGDSLAGGPLGLMRHRRYRDSGASTSRDSDVDIRELIRRYQTYTQPSCLPMEELLNRKREAVNRRPCTPDVRIHVVGQEAPRPMSSSGGGFRPGSGGPPAAWRGAAGSEDPWTGQVAAMEEVDLAAAAASVVVAMQAADRERRGEGMSDDLSRLLHPINGGKVVSPTLKTSLGEALFLDKDTPLDLE